MISGGAELAVLGVVGFSRPAGVDGGAVAQRGDALALLWQASQRLGRHRWTIDRTMAWLVGCRRLHRRYEREADHLLAFTSIACTLICCRRLGGFPSR